MVRRLFSLAVLPLLLGAADVSTLQDGVYRHIRTGVEFTLPAGWSLVSEGHADFGGHSVLLKDSVTDSFATVWMKSIDNEAADIPGLLERRLDVKLMQRNSFQNYRFREGADRHITVGPNQGLSVVADYANLGQNRSEYLTWVYSGKTHVFFDARVPTAQLAPFQERFNTLIQSAVIP